MLWPRPPAASVWDSLCKEFYVPVFFSPMGVAWSPGAQVRAGPAYYILCPISYISLPYTMAPAPAASFGIPFVKNSMCPYFFSLWGWRGAGAAQGPEAGKGENHRSGVVECKNGPK